MIPMISYNFTTSSKGLKVRMFFSCPPKRSGGWTDINWGLKFWSFVFLHVCIQNSTIFVACVFLNLLLHGACSTKKWVLTFAKSHFCIRKKKSIAIYTQGRQTSGRPRDHFRSTSTEAKVLVRFHLIKIYKICTWNLKQPVFSGCFSWMIPNHTKNNSWFSPNIH